MSSILYLNFFNPLCSLWTQGDWYQLSWHQHPEGNLCHMGQDHWKRVPQFHHLERCQSRFIGQGMEQIHYNERSEGWFQSPVHHYQTKKVQSCQFFLIAKQNGQHEVSIQIRMPKNHVSLVVFCRLLWALQNIPALKEAVKKNNAMFGTLDTWLLYKLSRGKNFMTDIANAAATGKRSNSYKLWLLRFYILLGLYDPFILDWSQLFLNLFGIPRSIMPPVVDSAGFHFGSTDPEIFGAAIPIRAVIADQSGIDWNLWWVDLLTLDSFQLPFLGLDAYPRETLKCPWEQGHSLMLILGQKSIAALMDW